MREHHNLTARNIPPGVDTSVPNVARVYDYMLGGTFNFPADRHLAELALQIAPDAPAMAQAHRAFLRRVVRHLAAGGVRQFLDIGSGLPTQGNTHEIAEQAAPGARTVYVDIDPVVVAHTRELLESSDTATIVQADIRDPAGILTHERLRGHLDLSQPVALLMCAILHHLHDHESPAAVAHHLVSALPPGSHVVISHFHNPGPALPDVAVQAAEAEKLFNERLGTGRWRTRDEILTYFTGTTLQDPGLVYLPDWRPDPDDYHFRGTRYYGDYAYKSLTYHSWLAGVGRKD
ncbi:SAM-dependent methyltransferase [Sphaerisporangium rubeum]|uniref:SAM-dependent methyltransferase n=1 Tax=Sphaerisporangium rubeum TaxID=321317 RepID=A0A7X0M6M6_9ACTN|nr:SAM-dependent methyltransferase [Sphaerisporangium rubeum]MBB6472011.1 SAM-dependent methyltransferase [Sphaerisporangium rubeum]